MGAVRGGGEHSGLSTGPVGVFAYTYRTALRAVVIGIALAGLRAGRAPDRRVDR